MAFESGRISCRIFFLPRTLPEDAVARFAENAAPPIESLNGSACQGWVSGRHLLDRQIDDETAHYGGYLRLALLHAQRKVPAPLLQAECRMEELAHVAAHDGAALSRKVRSTIKQSVMERLLPKMPPQLKGIPFIYDEAGLTLYASAMSVQQMDLFSVYFSHSLGFNLTPCLPDTAALLRKRVDVRDWQPATFSPAGGQDAEAQPGRDFLTWLWFQAEAKGGSVKVDGLGPIAFMLEGPLTFVLEGDGAHEITLRRGEPIFSAEAKAALLAGKKLRRAKLHFARGEETWETTFDADEFTFRALRLPDTESIEAAARFQERMIRLNEFRDIFLHLYDAYIDARRDAANWRHTVDEISAWVAARSARS